MELLRLELRKQEDREARLVDALNNSTIQAPSDGIVILGSTWRGGKVAEGDQIWRHDDHGVPGPVSMEVLAPYTRWTRAAHLEQSATIRVDDCLVRPGREREKRRTRQNGRQGSEDKYFTPKPPRRDR